MYIARVEFLDDGYVTATRQITAMDEVLDCYLHNPCSVMDILVDKFGEQEIKSAVITGFNQNYLKSLVCRLDSLNEPDSLLVETASSADVDLFAVLR